tara:strand:+ start:8901 stop:10259 length:1359 start_codon:yes stop_codon:yes gene_type:complete
MITPIVAGLMVACGGVNSKPSLSDKQQAVLEDISGFADVSSSPLDSDMEKLTVEALVIHSPWGPRGDSYRQLASLASRSEPGVPRIFQNQLAVGEAGLAAALDSLPELRELDIMLFPVQHLGDLVGSEELLALDKISGITELLDEGSYWGNTYSAGTINGRQFAVPLVLGPWFLMFNPKVFNKFGVEIPTSSGWSADVFADNVRRLTPRSSGSQDPESLGFLQLLPTTKGTQPLPPSWVWMQGMGSELPDRNHDSEVLNSNSALEAMKLMRRIVQEERSVVTMPTLRGRSVWGATASRDLAMMSLPTNSGWLLNQWRKKDGFDLAPMPKGQTTRTPTDIHMMAGISSRTNNVDAAAAGMKALANIVPSIIFPSALRKDLDRAVEVETVLRSQDMEYMQTALTKATSLNLSPSDRQFMTSELDHPVMLGEKSIEEIAQRAAKVLDDLSYSRER